MNNIDILEDTIEFLKENGDENFEKYCKAIETLIAENKELKDSNVELATTIDCLQTDLKEIKEEYSAEQKYEMKNTIPKSKVKENLKKAINNEIDLSKAMFEGDFTNGYIYALQSLLGKE